MIIDGRSIAVLLVGVSVLVAEPAALLVAVSAPILGACTTGTPVAVPPTWMLPSRAVRLVVVPP